MSCNAQPSQSNGGHIFPYGKVERIPPASFNFKCIQNHLRPSVHAVFLLYLKSIQRILHNAAHINILPYMAIYCFKYDKCFSFFYSKCNQSGFVNFDFAVNWIRSQNQRYISVDFSPSCFVLFPHQVVMHQDVYLIYTCKQYVFFVESYLLSQRFNSFCFTSMLAVIE